MSGVADAQGHGRAGAQLVDGTALMLSGGGYRAMLFHLGAIWRLNELGCLAPLSCVTGVSGGAILAAWLGLKWRELHFDAARRAENFAGVIAAPIMELTRRPLDIAAGLVGLALPHSTLPVGLRRRLLGEARLSDLPAAGAGPRVCLLATNLLTGSSCEFSCLGIRDNLLGEIAYPELPLATAVGASCSIPPTFKPVSIAVAAEQWTAAGDKALAEIRRQRVPLRLVDGGNYDNLGLVAAWDDYRILLVSDGASPMPPWRWVSGDWLTATLRSNRILIDQARQLRKRELIARRLSDPSWPQHGTYWGITSSIAGYGLADALCGDSEATHRLAHMRTRLGRHTPAEIGGLINWGYALCDAAMRAHVTLKAARPSAWPVPELPLK